MGNPAVPLWPTSLLVYPNTTGSAETRPLRSSHSQGHSLAHICSLTLAYSTDVVRHTHHGIATAAAGHAPNVKRYGNANDGGARKIDMIKFARLSSVVRMYAAVGGHFVVLLRSPLSTPQRIKSVSPGFRTRRCCSSSCLPFSFRPSRAPCAPPPWPARAPCH